MVDVPPGVLFEVETIRIAVADAPLEIDTVEGLTEHVAADVPARVMLQVRLTLPVYPLTDATVIEDVDVLPDVTEIGLNAAKVSV